MRVEPYVLGIETVAASGRACVLIDDGGTPGQQAGSAYLHPSRKTWVAVLTTPAQIQEISRQMPPALDELKLQTGAGEFHFAEIYGGKGDFDGKPLNLRLALFGFMQHIFATYMFPVIVQTLSAENLAEMSQRESGCDLFRGKVGVFDMTNPADAALFLLLCRVKWFLAENRSEFALPAYVVLDEGFRPAGRAIQVGNLGAMFHDKSIYTARSSEFCPVQLADFAVFCISRTQWLMTKQRRSLADDAFLRIIARVRLNTINLPETPADLATWKPSDYEKEIDEDRRGKGLKPYGAK
jgi:hypothetical protein